MLPAQLCPENDTQVSNYYLLIHRLLILYLFILFFMFDSLVYYLYLLDHRLNDLIDWYIDWYTDWLVIHGLMDGWMVELMIDKLIVWSNLLIAWFTDVINWLENRASIWCVELFYCIYCLIYWLKLFPSDCIGVIDCEWCELETDGVTRTRQAFCSTQRTCFGGILGARSPYNDHIPYRGKYLIQQFFVLDYCTEMPY